MYADEKGVKVFGLYNLNPTEDPDFRYSFADREFDPVLSKQEWAQINSARTAKYAGLTVDQIPPQDYIYAHNNAYTIINHGLDKFYVKSRIDSSNADATAWVEEVDNDYIENYAGYHDAAQAMRRNGRRGLRDPDSSEKRGGRRGDVGLADHAERSPVGESDLGEGDGAGRAALSDTTYSPDYAYWRNVVKDEPQLSLADDLTPELREEFVNSFDAQFGEGAVEAMFKTHDQMHIKRSRLCKRTCNHGQPLRITDSHISI